MRSDAHAAPRSPPERGRSNTIVVGVEGSRDSQLALRWALEEARQRGATLRIVHAYQTAGSRAIVEHLDRLARQVMDGAVRQAASDAPDVSVLPEIARDEAAASALLARAAEADLLVLGCRGLGGFTGLLVGSVSDQCARHAPCPVAIIRQTAGSPGAWPRSQATTVPVTG